ncbi:hypothetical protein C8A05DRAFT_29193 [Staphylotrichum tortipilum]|uniref:Uncharacterized protein n=1 Tax=Staphylotrichum tortipilum TaxID=2831512 RepID=A0AAN6MVJ0_9PEZI|nr:hypothetical protein C8A05DRAFT_29193 [Staphylotrichum longicolle]
MHPASSLAEAPPIHNNNNNISSSNINTNNVNNHANHANHSDDTRTSSSLLPPLSPRNHAVPPSIVTEDHVMALDPGSPLARKDTTSSVSTAATALSSLTHAAEDAPGSPYSSVTSSPILAAHAHPVFSAKDGSNVGLQRRASRRRTGPLTALQRDRAHLIRKMGACSDCRRRRVACHPNHHDMTWEEAARRFRSHDASAPTGLSPVDGPQLSPAPPLNARPPPYTHDPREMDIDVSPTQQHAPPSSLNHHHNNHTNESRIRTPLPSGPRPEKHAMMHMAPLPGFDAFRADLQGSADRILASPHRSRYANVSVLLVCWQDDQDPRVQAAMGELAKTFREDYRYRVQTKSIPSAAGTEGSKSPWLWLSQVVTHFIADHDQRDCLNIFYYCGYSYLDGDRDTVLASSKHPSPTTAPPIRWRSIQDAFENARSDALLLLDCAYYPSYTSPRREGMLELLAASAGEDHVSRLGRGVFTRAVAEQLRRRAARPFKEPFSAAELHAQLVGIYPGLMAAAAEEEEEKGETVARWPTPLSMQLAGTKTLPSILLAPMEGRSNNGGGSGGRGESGSPVGGGATQISITFRLADDSSSGSNTFNMDGWAEWLRLMPGGITEARVEGPYRNTTFQ